MTNRDDKRPGKIGNTSNLPKPQSIQNFYWFFTEKLFSETVKIKQRSKIETCLKKYCVSYTFQLEQGDSGFLHFQGSCKLLKRMRLSGVKKILSDSTHWEATRNVDAANEYCMKDETRVEGPWIWDKETENDFSAEDLGLINESDLYDWQREIVEMILTKPEKRRVYWYYDDDGNVGKTEFTKYLKFHHNAEFIQGKKSDIMQIISGKNGTNPAKPIYILGYSRSNEHYVSYDAIESIKDGLICSTKYESSSRLIPIPHVLIFCNFPPDESKLSADRWIIKKLKSNI